MPVGSFPSLNSVKDVKEFDGSPEKLNDFLASVEGNMAAYNIPLSQGGYVAGNVDDGWSCDRYSSCRVSSRVERQS
jgi:hypothetical protein